MSKNYSIDQTTKTLVFAEKPKSLDSVCVKGNDRLSFTSVVIPNSVASIGDRSFAFCYALASAHTPNSVNLISPQAFFACHSLASIHIPNSVATIGQWAFCDCYALTSVHIPNSVSTIEIWAFKECPHLHKVCVSSNVAVPVNWASSFDTKTALLRPRLNPIIPLQKKSACRSSKTSHSIYL